VCFSCEFLNAFAHYKLLSAVSSCECIMLKLVSPTFLSNNLAYFMEPVHVRACDIKLRPRWRDWSCRIRIILLFVSGRRGTTVSF
jgi:hypothetical protein